MENSELLMAISQMMDEKPEPINDRLDSIEEKLDNQSGALTFFTLYSFLIFAHGEQSGNTMTEETI